MEPVPWLLEMADLPLETWTSNILSNLHENIVGNTEKTHIYHLNSYKSMANITQVSQQRKLTMWRSSSSLHQVLWKMLWFQFWTLVKYLPILWMRLALSCPSDINRKFWQFSRGKNDHPATDDHVPVSLYGDEVQVNRQGDSITAMYLSLTLFNQKGWGALTIAFGQWERIWLLVVIRCGQFWHS